MLVKIKKSFMGHGSVRDFLVKKCISLGEDLTLELNEDYKIFPHSVLSDYLNSEHMTECTSKFDGKKYNLVDFPWD
jgi:hypothetical protein